MPRKSGRSRARYFDLDTENDNVVYVVSDYTPAPYPEDVVNHRQIIIHEELPDNTSRGSQLQVFVRKVNSPSEFWINLCGPDYSRKLVALSSEMRQFYEQKHSSYLLPSYAVRSGQFCVCLYNEWYRVRIENVDKDNVDVFLIDCGSTVSVNVDSLRFMHKKFSSLPIQSFLADLADVKPTGSDEWQTSVCEFFRQETAGKKFCVNVVELMRERHSLSVRLLDSSKKSVADKLVSKNMAKYVTQGFEIPETGTSDVQVNNVVEIPDMSPSSECLPEDTDWRSANTLVSCRNVEHKDVYIAGKRLLLVTIEDKNYFVLPEFLEHFTVLHEHVVLKLLELFPARVVVEKMEFQLLRHLLGVLMVRRVRGLGHLSDRAIIPCVRLLPVTSAYELLTILRVDASDKISVRNFVSTLS